MRRGPCGGSPHSGHRPDEPLRAEASSFSRRLEILPLLIVCPHALARSLALFVHELMLLSFGLCTSRPSPRPLHRSRSFLMYVHRAACLYIRRWLFRTSGIELSNGGEEIG